MKEHIEKARKQLEEADIAKCFEELDKVENEMPSELKTVYNTHKQKFMQGKQDWDFNQQLYVFLKVLEGNNKIDIKSIDEERITLDIDGEIREIKSLLENFQNLSQLQGSKSIQYVNKIYNIEHINEANFGLLSGKRNFNEILLEELTAAISPYSKNARVLIEYVQKKKVENWMHQKKYVTKAKDFISVAYVGVIGIKLRQLMAIGSEQSLSADLKIEPYVDKCISIARASIDLLIFCFMSKLWDQVVVKKVSLDLEEKAVTVLREFFERKVEPDLSHQFALLKVLYRIFTSQNIALPFTEMKGFESELVENSRLSESIDKLHKLYSKKRDNDFIECAEAEVELSALLGAFNFLANYEMVSIKQVGYKYLRNNTPRYIHHYFRVEQENKEGAERFYSAEEIASDTVLLYKDKYQEGINLFPFVIDYNVLNLNTSSKLSNIYFYQCRNFSDSTVLDYASMQKDKDNIEEIRQSNIDVSPEDEQAIPDDQRLQALNFNYILAQFDAAKKALLGSLAEDEGEDEEFENLFD